MSAKAPRASSTAREPAPRSHLILVTDHVTDLLPTILSRCLPVPFRFAGWRQIATRLEAEGLSTDGRRRTGSRGRTSALSAGAFARAMRLLGVDLAEHALRATSRAARWCATSRRG